MAQLGNLAMSEMLGIRPSTLEILAFAGLTESKTAVVLEDPKQFLALDLKRLVGRKPIMAIRQEHRPWYVKNSNPDLSVMVADGGPADSFDLPVLKGSFELMIWSGG